MADPDELLSGLDAEQRVVATSFGRPVVVIAGAGTGKTRAITHRIAYAVASGHYRANAVLAVTFTTRAAGELRSRLRGLGVPAVQARTFHSAALRQAQYFWPRGYGCELPPVSQERLPLVAQAARALRLSPDTATLRDLLGEVSWAKVTNVLPADYGELATVHGRQVAGLEPDQVARLLGHYEQVKTEQGVIDFDDILLCAVALLTEHEDIAAEVRAGYRHLVVDEYQDVNPLQQSLLDLWWGEGADHCVVGDPAQTIHSFAGASPSHLLGFAGRFPDAHLVRLMRDYRSSPQVVELANQVARRTGLGAVTLESQCPAGPAPVVLACADEADEAAAIARWLVGQHDAGVPWRELAVLYRVHAQSPPLEAALAKAGIRFAVRGGDGFYDRAEIRQLMTALARAAERDADAPAVPQVTALLRRMGWSEQPPTGSGRIRERWEALSAILTLAEDCVAAEASASVGRVAAELAQRAQVEHPLAADGVTLATLHAAKGLEWTAVALAGVQEGTLPLGLAQSEEQLAEEARLCYVGITRARRSLLITWSRTWRGGGARQPSRFLAGVSTSARPDPPRRAVRQVPTTEMNARCRVCGRPVTSGAERKLSRHLSCPAEFDQGLFDGLIAWRSQVAQSRSLPAYVVFTDATLMAIAELCPDSRQALAAIPGVGRVKLDAYADEVLAILAGGIEASHPQRRGMAHPGRPEPENPGR